MKLYQNVQKHNKENMYRNLHSPMTEEKIYIQIWVKKRAMYAVSIYI